MNYRPSYDTDFCKNAEICTTFFNLATYTTQHNTTSGYIHTVYAMGATTLQ